MVNEQSHTINSTNEVIGNKFKQTYFPNKVLQTNFKARINLWTESEGK